MHPVMILQGSKYRGLAIFNITIFFFFFPPPNNTGIQSSFSGVISISWTHLYILEKVLQVAV